MKPTSPTKATQQQPQGSRAADLKMIHALQRDVGLSTDDARSLKLALTGVASAGDMSGPQRSQLLAHLRMLKGRMAPAAKPAKPVKPVKAAPKPRPKLSPQHKKIWALWQTLADAGVVRDRCAAALNAYIKRQTGVDHLAWVNAPQGDLLIESLKAWCERTGADERAERAQPDERAERAEALPEGRS